MRSSNGRQITYSPDILKQNLHQVQVVMIDADSLVQGYDSRPVSELPSAKHSDNSENKVSTQKIKAYSLSSALSFNSTIEIKDVINESFGSVGTTGTFVFNRIDKLGQMAGNAIGGQLGAAVSKLPPIVPKLSYERKTAYGGATAIGHKVDLIFPYVSDFKTDVIVPVDTLCAWYLPNRRSTDIGKLLGTSVSLLEKKAGDSVIVEGIKAIGSAIQDIAGDIFNNCFLLEVPVGAQNPTRIYIGPEDSGMNPVYCGEWLVNSFGMTTSDFVIYDNAYNCLRPAFVTVSLGLMSWRVTDNKSFQVFNNSMA